MNALTRFIIIGQVGTDAGYWVFEDGHWVHKGGWETDRLAEISRSINILGEASRLKTPGLADAASRTIGEFLNRELSAQLGDQIKGGAVVIINTPAR